MGEDVVWRVAVKPSLESVGSSSKMGHVLVQERSSIQKQKLDAFREGIPLPRTEDKHEVGHSFLVSGQNGSSHDGGQFKSSGKDPNSWLEQKSCNADEIVKHMSQLPGFLQQAEKENSIQEKALNFGVLDWKRLEKWKYNEPMPGKYHKKASSAISNSKANGQPKLSSKLKMQASLHASSVSPGKQSMPHSHSSHVSSSMEERTITSRKEAKDVEGTESKEKEARGQQFQAPQSSSTHEQPHSFHQHMHFNARRSSKSNSDSSSRKDPKKGRESEKEASSSELGKHKLSLPLNDKTKAQVINNEARLDDRVDLASVCCSSDQDETTELLRPKQFPKGSCSESSQFTKSIISFDGQLSELMGNRKSDRFPPHPLCSGEIGADIIPSCPSPSDVTVPTESAMEAHNLVSSQATEVGICNQNMSSVTSIHSEGKCSMVIAESRRPSFSVEASDKTQEEIAQPLHGKGRPLSPTHLFSFNLARISRSSGFKERLAVPQLSSTYTTNKSGPVRAKVSSVTDSSEIGKTNATSRGRTSPLRRLLDPLLKQKGAQSVETVQPPDASSRSMTSRTMGTKRQPQDRKPEASTFQALLQLTLKNGFPFFKLVVDNSSNMLAAVVKKLTTTGKSDPCLIYAFYCVHEIRKKSMDWISQGSKSKSCSLDYDIVGQMKIATSRKVKSLGSTACIARECVLYGFDSGQGNEQKLKFLPNKEIAAIVVKTSSEKLLSDRNQQNNERECRPRAAEILDAEKDKNSNGTVVILPGGVHSVPIKGAPSSLISRWRSGGSCDCGGWDIGCKLRILTDNRKKSNSVEASIRSSTTDRLDLFVQGGKSKPVFRLEPFSDEFYSIQSDASISLLEAFATCVAHITCHKFSDILDTKDQSQMEPSVETIIATDKMKTAATFQGQFPPKYVTCPPLSPAGRV